MSDQDAMTAAWKLHRHMRFRVSPAGGGLLVVDMTRQPPRAWAARVEATGLRVRVASLPDAFSGTQGAEMVFARVWEVGLGKDLTPPEAAVLMGAVEGAESWAALSVRRFSESLEARMRARLPMEPMLGAEVTRLDQQGLGALKAGLDMEALGVLSACEDFGWKDYAYYAVKGAEGSLDAYRRTVRHQAARAYPLLASFIANRFGIKADLDKQAKFMLDRTPIKAALDIAKAAGNAIAEADAKKRMELLPKPPALLDSLDRALTPSPTHDNPEPKPIVSRPALGRIVGVARPPLGIRPEYLSMQISELPPDWFPKKGADWKAEEWEAFIDLTATVGTVLPRITGSRPETLYEGCGGKWGEMRDRVVRAFTDSRVPGGLEGDQATVLESAVDWKTIRALPRHKVEAAAEESALRLEPTLPEGVSKEDVSDWIIRLVAPNRSREVISNSCMDTEIPISLLANKVMLPMAVYMTGDPDPMLNAEQFDVANVLAAHLIFGGKSAVKVFESLSEFHRNGAAIRSGGTLLPHELLERENEAGRKQKALVEAAKNLRRQAGAAASVGVDVNAPRDFPIPLPPVILAPNGVYICLLTTQDMFNDEGRGPKYGHDINTLNPDGSHGLDICTGSNKYHYDGALRDGELFFSMRVPEGDSFRRLALHKVEAFSPQGAGWITHTLEFKGKTNGNVPELAREASDWFMEQMKMGCIENAMREVAEGIRLKTTKLDRIEDVCGYDWTETPRIGSALEAWMPLLPKRARLSASRFMQLPEMQALADSLSPGWRQKADLREASWGKQSYIKP